MFVLIAKVDGFYWTFPFQKNVLIENKSWKKMSDIELNSYEIERSFCQGCREEILASDLRPISVDHYRNSIKYERDVRDTLSLFLKKSFGTKTSELVIYKRFSNKNRLNSFYAFPRKYREYSYIINPDLWLYEIEKELNHEQILIYRLISECQAKCLYNAKCYCLRCRKGYCGHHWDKKLKICKPCRNKENLVRKVDKI